jgi:hypothetical protein
VDDRRVQFLDEAAIASEYNKVEVYLGRRERKGGETVRALMCLHTHISTAYLNPAGPLVHRAEMTGDTNRGGLTLVRNPVGM